MIVYHGSSVEVAKPDLGHSRSVLDFGRGFYTTPLYEQAAKWSSRFKRRGLSGIVSHYILEDRAFQELKVLKFDTYSEAIKRLRFEKPNVQICLRSERALEQYLHFEGSKQV